MKILTTIAKELLELDVGDTTKDWEDENENGEPFPYPYLFKCVVSEQVDTSRWSLIYERVYKDLYSGKYYSTSYSRGATESQDERPYQDEGEHTEFMEVVPRETITTEYVAAPRTK